MKTINIKDLAIILATKKVENKFRKVGTAYKKKII